MMSSPSYEPPDPAAPAIAGRDPAEPGDGLEEKDVKVLLLRWNPESLDESALCDYSDNIGDFRVNRTHIKHTIDVLPRIGRSQPRQHFDSHIEQVQRLEIHLFTRDLATEELQQSLNLLSRYVLRTESIQAEYQVMRQQYNKLHNAFESLKRTSNAAGEECQQLQVENTRLQLQGGTDSANSRDAVRRKASGLWLLDECRVSIWSRGARSLAAAGRVKGRHRWIPGQDCYFRKMPDSSRF